MALQRVSLRLAPDVTCPDAAVSPNEQESDDRAPAAMEQTATHWMQRQRFEELEAYRGLGALLIVVFHAYQFSREGLGLSRYLYEDTALHLLFFNLRSTTAWFFVLSGFLVFLPFAREAIQQRTPRTARGFLVHRAVRILPAYYLALVVVWTWRFSGSPEQWVDLVEHLTFTHIFDRAHIFWTIGPAWSLGVEFYFYLFIAVFGPLAFKLCGRLRSARDRAAILTLTLLALGLLSAAYKALAFYVLHVPRDDYPAYYGVLAKLDVLVLGMLLAIGVAMARGRPWLRGAPAGMVLVAGLIVQLLAYLGQGRSEIVDLYLYTLSGVAFLLVLASTVLGPPGSPWQRAVSLRPFQFLGLISYSLFLWHEPLMLELAKQGLLISPAPESFPRNAAVLLLVAVIAGAASYWLIEKPTLLLRHLFTREGRLARRYPRERLQAPELVAGDPS
jgi:peptidoglycan/LPS O-acetylase OafA/YrhL